MEDGVADVGGADGEDAAVEGDDFGADFGFAVGFAVFAFKTGADDGGAGVEAGVFGDVDVEVVDPEGVVVDVADGDDAIFFPGDFCFFEGGIDQHVALAGGHWVLGEEVFFGGPDDDDDAFVVFENVFDYLKMAVVERLEAADI